MLRLAAPTGAVQSEDAHDLAIDLADKGAGVALTRLLLGIPTLLNRQLVMPFTAHLPASERYFIATKKVRPDTLAEHCGLAIQNQVQKQEDAA